MYLYLFLKKKLGMRISQEKKAEGEEAEGLLIYYSIG